MITKRSTIPPKPKPTESGMTEPACGWCCISIHILKSMQLKISTVKPVMVSSGILYNKKHWQ